MINYFKHFWLICKHKYYVAKVLTSYGLYWQAITHDLSKFHPKEFVRSAKYYCGNGSPIEKEKSIFGYSTVWLRHKGRNKHHWQYWVDYEEGKYIINNIPEIYLKEMVADIIGASKTYLGKSYKKSEPYFFFCSKSKDWLMTEHDKLYVKDRLLDYVI